MIRVTVWNEYCHEQEEERIRKKEIAKSAKTWRVALLSNF